MYGTILPLHVKQQLGPGDFAICFFSWWLQLDTRQCRGCYRTQEMTSSQRPRSYHPIRLQWLLRERKVSKKCGMGAGDGSPCTLQARMQISIATVENSVEGSWQIKNIASIWFSNPTTGHVFKGSKINISKSHLHLHIHWSTIHNRQELETI